MLQTTHVAQDRREALSRLCARGTDPFPHSYAGRRTAAALRRDAAALAAGETLFGPAVRAAGRLVGMRRLGRIAFFDVRDSSGTIQLLLDRRVLGSDAFAHALEHQRGDHVGACGALARTRAGEVSIVAREVDMLSKTLIAPSAELLDLEVRRRHREADLIANADSRTRFLARATIVRVTRDYLHELGFVEVETPILQPLYGGAEARPFVTRHNALEADMYLRIAPELYLKRCVVGGLDQVFELGRNFRNEGISSKHNPEFTALEFYEAYADYQDHLRRVERLVHRAAIAIGHPDAGSFAPPWPRVRLHEAILERTGIDVLGLPARAELQAAAVAAGMPDPGRLLPWVEIVDRLQSRFVEPAFTRPTFLIDHPAATTPLAKRHRDDERLAERFEAFVGGMEIANAFTELNDPDEQRERFLATTGTDEHEHPLDEDFLAALGRGMPPTAGCGIGIDRLAMVLTGTASIRDIILFPALRPLGGS
jgi:lysyl-tRNA synthetase, class II